MLRKIVVFFWCDSLNKQHTKRHTARSFRFTIHNVSMPLECVCGLVLESGGVAKNPNYSLELLQVLFVILVVVKMKKVVVLLVKMKK